MNKQNWPYNNAVDPRIYSKRTDWPKISIVTPSFNQGQFIEETILSVLNQNYPSLEFFIIDGGSTDNTVEIIEKYKDRITYWVSEKDNGQAHAINKGFEQCTGDIIGWINSDDYYLEKYLFHISSSYLKRPFDIITSNSITYHQDTDRYVKDYGRSILERYYTCGGLIPSHTTFWSKKIHKNVDENIHCAMDYELWMRLLPNRKLKYLNIFGAVFRLHNESKSFQSDTKMRDVWEKDMVYIENKHKITRPDKYLRKEFYYISLILSTYRRFCYKLKND